MSKPRELASWLSRLKIHPPPQALEARVVAEDRPCQGGRVRRVDNAHRMTKDDNRRSVLGAAAFERVGDGPGSRAGWDPPWMVRPKKGGESVEDFSRGYVEVAFS